jgi:predicted DNA-binding protein
MTAYRYRSGELYVLMPGSRSFHLPEEVAARLDAIAKEHDRPTEDLLAQIVSEYIEVTEFILRKEKAKKPTRTQSKGLTPKRTPPRY